MSIKPSEKSLNGFFHSGDYSIPEESFVCANRFSCSSTTVLRSGRSLQKHDYTLPPDANYILYEDTTQIENSKSNNPIPSHYETAENQEVQILPFLSNGHYEMSSAIMYNPGAIENGTNQTDYSELVHNSHQNGKQLTGLQSIIILNLVNLPFIH